MIPCANPGAQYRAHRQDIDTAIRRVCDSDRYILGPEVEAFEHEFAAYLGVGHAVGVASGTDAITLALMACGIGPGDEVVTVAHTAVASVAAIERAGAVPVLADIEAGPCTIDPGRFEAAITERTKAVLPVHLYGQSADLDAVMEIARRHGLRVIEDCAQAPGATLGGRRLGAIGDAGCFSFYPTKNLGALGDGGLVATGDAALAARLRQLRQYGWDGGPVSQLPGLNSRLDELQAAVLRAKLPHLDADNARRAALAGRYDDALAGLGLGLPVRRQGAGHVHHLYVVRAADRDGLKAHLERAGVIAGIHYPVPVHLQPAYRGRLAGSDALAESERAANEVLSLPLYPELEDGAVDRVAAAIREFADA